MNECEICAKMKQTNSKEIGCQNLANSWALYNGISKEMPRFAEP